MLVLYTVFGIILVLIWIWGSAAILIAGPTSLIIRLTMLCVFIVCLPAAFYFSNSLWLGLIYSSIAFAVLLVWWASLKPSNDKDWAAEVVNIPYGTIRNDILTLHNVRNFDYQSKTEFTQKWETRLYDLTELASLDLFLSYWSSPHITHTILSWGFANGDHLAVSIETRKDKFQIYSAIEGFFKQYTLAYIAADERDLIHLRTNHRKEEVYVYRLQNIPKERIRASLESYVDHMNQLVKKPAFYHALTMNCTSTIEMHSTINPDKLPSDWRLIANGHVDEMLYDYGILRQDLAFEQLRAQSRIDKIMQESAVEVAGDNFSAVLRKAAKIE